MSAKRLTRKSFRVSLSWRMEILRLFITRKHANIFSNTKHVIINSVYIYWIKYKLNEIRRQYFFAVCLRIIRYVRSGKKYHVELITINACVKINFLKQNNKVQNTSSMEWRDYYAAASKTKTMASSIHEMISRWPRVLDYLVSKIFQSRWNRFRVDMET